MRRYFYGWWMFFRAIRLARRKKHGAGKIPWRNAIKMGACHRYLVDGQFRRRLMFWLKPS